jgi:hypothetical protein
VLKVKTIAIQKRQTNITLMTLGARERTFKAFKIIIALLSYTPIQISHVRISQSNCQVSGPEVTLKSNSQRFL